MRLYTPALYLFARTFLKPDHPFCAYLLLFLIRNIIDGKGWMHVSPESPKKLCSYCTALSLLTLVRGVADFDKAGLGLSSLNDNLLTLNSLIGRMENMDKPIELFVSYSSNDEVLTSKAAEILKSYGFNVTYAEFDLLVGDSIPGFINDGLRRMDYFIIFFSTSSISSKFVKSEFEGAKSQEWLNDKVIILPALLEDCTIPPILSPKKYADFRTSFDSGIKQLINSIRKHHAKRKINP